MATQVAKQVASRARRPAVSADIAIVAAKITAPGAPDWALTRPRITKLIAEGRRWCPLTLVTALAGSGKTMALSLWAAAEPGTAAWVTVDEFDNRPGVFWAHVVAALRRSGVAVPGALPSARGRDAGHVFLLRLAATLAAQATAVLTTGEPRSPVPHPNRAALVALAWVHLEHNELREAHNRLKQADAVGVTADRLIGAVAWLTAAYAALATGHAAAGQIIATARSGWSVPAWLDQWLSLAESRALTRTSDPFLSSSRSPNASGRCCDTPHACSTALRPPARCTSPSTRSRRTSLTFTASWRPPAAARRSAEPASLT
jgi:hypothetical protein